MKKLLLFSIVILLNAYSYAGVGSLTVTNNASCAVTVTMSASFTLGSCTPVCYEYISSTFTVAGGGTTAYWCDPVDFQSGSCSSTPIGWAIYPCGSFLSTLFDFTWNTASWTYGGGCSGLGCTPDYTATGLVGSWCAACATAPAILPFWGSIGTPGCPAGIFMPLCVRPLDNVVITIW